MINKLIVTFLGGFLLFQGIKDYRCRAIRADITIVGIIILGIVNFYLKRPLPEVIMALIPGLAFIFVCIITSGKIGLGDGLITLLVGLCIGLRRCVFLTMLSCIFSMFFAMYEWIFAKKSKEYAYPFVPFMIPAYTCMCFMEYVNL